MGHITNPLSLRIGFSMSWVDSWFTESFYITTFFYYIYHIKLYLKYVMRDILSYFFKYEVTYSHTVVFKKYNKLLIYGYLYDSFVQILDNELLDQISGDFKKNLISIEDITKGNRFSPAMYNKFLYEVYYPLKQNEISRLVTIVLAVSGWNSHRSLLKNVGDEFLGFTGPNGRKGWIDSLVYLLKFIYLVPMNNFLVRFKDNKRLFKHFILKLLLKFFISKNRYKNLLLVLIHSGLRHDSFSWVKAFRSKDEISGKYIVFLLERQKYFKKFLINILRYKGLLKNKKIKNFLSIFRLTTKYVRIYFKLQNFNIKRLFSLLLMKQEKFYLYFLELVLSKMKHKFNSRYMKLKNKEVRFTNIFIKYFFLKLMKNSKDVLPTELNSILLSELFRMDDKFTINRFNFESFFLFNIFIFFKDILVMHNPLESSEGMTFLSRMVIALIFLRVQKPLFFRLRNYLTFFFQTYFKVPFLDLKFLLIKNDTVNAGFIMRYAARKLFYGHTLHEVMGPLKRELDLLSGSIMYRDQQLLLQRYRLENKKVRMYNQIYKKMGSEKRESLVYLLKRFKTLHVDTYEYNKFQDIGIVGNRFLGRWDLLKLCDQLKIGGKGIDEYSNYSIPLKLEKMPIDGFHPKVRFNHKLYYTPYTKFLDRFYRFSVKDFYNFNDNYFYYVRTLRNYVDIHSLIPKKLSRRAIKGKNAANRNVGKYEYIPDHVYRGLFRRLKSMDVLKTAHGYNAYKNYRYFLFFSDTFLKYRFSVLFTYR